MHTSYSRRRLSGGGVESWRVFEWIQILDPQLPYIIFLRKWSASEHALKGAQWLPFPPLLSHLVSAACKQPCGPRLWQRLLCKLVCSESTLGRPNRLDSLKCHMCVREVSFNPDSNNSPIPPTKKNVFPKNFTFYCFLITKTYTCYVVLIICGLINNIIGSWNLCPPQF